MSLREKYTQEEFEALEQKALEPMIYRVFLEKIYKFPASMKVDFDRLKSGSYLEFLNTFAQYEIRQD